MRPLNASQERIKRCKHCFLLLFFSFVFLPTFSIFLFLLFYYFFFFFGHTRVTLHYRRNVRVSTREGKEAADFIRCLKRGT